jgi:hypothetical protein
MAHTASSTIRQIGLPVSRESRFSRAFVSGRIDATSLGYSLVFRGRPFASASAAGRPGPRFRLSVAISFPNLTILQIGHFLLSTIHWGGSAYSATSIQTVKLLAPLPERIAAKRFDQADILRSNTRCSGYESWAYPGACCDFARSARDGVLPT